jgi:hypothetical protein
MWSDEIDKKIRETTEGSHHAYDDKAWNKMEELLDKYLPQKRRRRFIPLFLLSLALIGTGVFFALQKQPENNVTGEKITTVEPILGQETVQNENETKTATISPALEKINDPVRPTETEVAISTVKVSKPGLNKQPVPGKKNAEPRSQEIDELTGPDLITHAEKKQEKDRSQQITDKNKDITSTPLAPAADQPLKNVDKEEKDAGQVKWESGDENKFVKNKKFNRRISVLPFQRV